MPRLRNALANARFAGPVAAGVVVRVACDVREWFVITMHGMTLLTYLMCCTVVVFAYEGEHIGGFLPNQLVQDCFNAQIRSSHVRLSHVQFASAVALCCTMTQ